MACQLVKYDLCVFQNATYRLNMNLKDGNGFPLDISTWTFTGDIRETPSTAGSIIASFDIVVLSVPSAIVELILHPVQSALLTKRRYYYDIIATDNSVFPNDVFRIMQGKIDVNLGVTPI